MSNRTETNEKSPAPVLIAATLSEILSAVVHEDAGAVERLRDYLWLLELEDSAIDRVVEAVHLRDAVSPYLGAQRVHLSTIVEREWIQMIAALRLQHRRRND
jgi:hypothetical protein